MLENVGRKLGVGVTLGVLSFTFFGCTGDHGINSGIRTATEPPGQRCEYGGLKVDTGLDRNRSGSLDDFEVAATEYVCNQRVDGKTSLVFVKSEAPGKNCENGGIRIDFGLDDNNDYQLQPSEIDNTQFVCNGRSRLLDILPVAPGSAACAQGGIEVRAGYDLDADHTLEKSEVDVSKVVCHGDAHLVKVDEAAPGAQCPAGGIRVQSGFDRNGNHLLDAGEVQGIEFVCNGKDGKNTLVKHSNIPASATGPCFFGGTRLESGLDQNSNGTLEASEVLTTQDICSVQVNKSMTLVKNSAILPGPVCTYGGVKIEVGIDDNDNHILEASEVDSTADQCSSVIIVDGLTTLTTTASASAVQCPFGGIVLRSGLDKNRNGVLDTEEYSDIDVICNGANGYNGVTKTEPYSGSQCSSGAGIRVKSGLDLNRNGVLDDPGEVQNTSYVCNGAAGKDGISTLIRTSNAGSICGSYGGTRFESGMDVNRDNILQPAEVQNTAYVCNGQDGLNALVALFDAGSACGPFGGTRIEVGLDLDGDLSLDTSEATQYSYVCNGADGYSVAVESSEDYWAACGGAWGVRILTGLDLDFDGYLDSSEIQYENYVCEPL